jgi:SAM-dependent methyltransferase
MNCRHCSRPLHHSFVDLGSAPPSNAYLTVEKLKSPEKWYPLQVMVCDGCWLVQTLDYAQAHELFDADYAYFSSFSASWLDHAKRYVGEMTRRFGLDENSHVVEVASNDGYLLQFVRERGIPCTGIEPTASTAAAARARGIDTIEMFFGAGSAARLVGEGRQADLMAANNVLAHVPDINDFLRGFATLLKPTGVATFEFPHLLRLMAERQFDTIYHEHFSYLSLTALRGIMVTCGLTVFDVEEIPTHGGSLRVFVQRTGEGQQPISPGVDRLEAIEVERGLRSLGSYRGFQAMSEQVKDEFLSFLIDARRRGKHVGAYGAAAKGNTLLNFAGVRPDLLTYVVDRNPAKQNKFLPGSRIPIVDEAHLKSAKPDYVVILPWNLRAEVLAQLDYVRAWGGKFVTAVPKLEIID